MFDTRENLLSQSGLFVGMAEGRAGFAHLSFQEFFAAQRAFTVNDERLPEVFLERAQTAEWRNTLSFLFGRLLSAFSEPKKALDLLQAQIETVSGSDTGQLLVLADAAQVLTCKGITVPSECHSRLKDLLLTAMRGPADVTTRAAAGSALGWLGDPRFREDRLWLPDEDLLGFIRVAPGAFLMGSDPRLAQQAKDNERPQHAVELPGYYIGRHPVTVAQFQAFVDDSAFGVSEAYPRPWAESLRTIPNHAIVSVTFQDARVYCNWFTDALKRAEWTPPRLREHLAKGWIVRLPSEAEWEKAARGAVGATDAWSDEINATDADSLSSALKDSGNSPVTESIITTSSPEDLRSDCTSSVLRRSEPWTWQSLRVDSKLPAQLPLSSDGRRTRRFSNLGADCTRHHASRKACLPTYNRRGFVRRVSARIHEATETDLSGG